MASWINAAWEALTQGSASTNRTPAAQATPRVASQQPAQTNEPGIRPAPANAPGAFDPVAAEEARRRAAGAVENREAQGLFADYAAERSNAERRMANEEVSESDARVIDRTRREEALGLGNFETASINELTDDEYRALSDRERTAIDYNTMLYNAVKADRDNQDLYEKASEGERKAYNSLSRELFGETRGSDLYAPETLQLLSDLKLTDQASDLDDYLDLRAGISDRDLDLLSDRAASESSPLRKMSLTQQSELPTQAPFAPDFNMERADLVNTQVDATERIGAALIRGNRMLSDFASSRRAYGNDGVVAMGGQAAEQEPSLGFGDPGTAESPTVDGKFQLFYKALAKADVDTSETFKYLNQQLSPSEQSSFREWAGEQAARARRFNVDLGSESGVSYRTYDEFEKLLNEIRE